MAVPELVLGENVAQKLHFPLFTPIKLLKHVNIHAQNTLICQENRKLISCILAFPLPSLGIVINPIQNSKIVFEYQCFVCRLHTLPTLHLPTHTQVLLFHLEGVDSIVKHGTYATHLQIIDIILTHVFSVCPI